MSMSRPSRAGRDDPAALRSPAMCRFFSGVMRRQMAASFRAVRLARPGVPDVPADRPVIVYSNHPSWWDPAFYIVLMPRLFPDREGFGPMEAEALEKYPFMKRIGIFGIAPDSRAGAARFLSVSQSLLSRPRRMLWVTAQGTFADPRQRPVALRPGIAHLLARMPEAVAVPLAMEYPFWTEKRPEALALFGQPVRGEAALRPREQAARLEDALEQAMDRLAALAQARDPRAFDMLLEGRRGTGGVYAAVGRAKAALGGRRYEPDHAREET